MAPGVGANAAGSISVGPPEWFLRHPWLQEAGVAVTAENASQVAAVYACCRLITDCCAGAEIVCTERQTGGRREVLHDDPVSWILEHGADPRLAPDAPPAVAIREALFWSTLLLGDGNGYAEIQRDGSGRFYALWPIDPTRVTPKRDETGYYYEIRQYAGGLVRLQAMDMFHMHGPSLTGWVGDSIVYRGAKVIGTAHASNVFTAAYYANGTAVSGVLESDKAVTPKQAEDAKAEWKRRHGGVSKAHDISVLGQGLKYKPTNHNAQEAALVEQKKFGVAEVARFYGVPTPLINENEAWTALSELYRGFYTTLRIWTKRFDEEATRKLYPWRAPWRQVSHDLTYLTLGNFKDQIEALTKGTGKPVLTVNEARSMLGKNSVPGGDALAPKPSAIPRAEPDEPPADKPAPVNIRPVSPAAALRSGMVTVLERHARESRQQRSPQRAERLRMQARSEIRELSGALDARDVSVALESVEAGVTPDAAADHLLGVHA